jgi:ribosomal protein S18 acetylase RimI-like enzyme
MTAALQRLDASDIPVSLWVLEGNERAVRFYRRHGFVPDGATKPEVIGDADVVELRLVRPR